MQRWPHGEQCLGRCRRRDNAPEDVDGERRELVISRIFRSRTWPSTPRSRGPGGCCGTVICRSRRASRYVKHSQARVLRPRPSLCCASARTVISTDGSVASPQRRYRWYRIRRLASRAGAAAKTHARRLRKESWLYGTAVKAAPNESSRRVEQARRSRQRVLRPERVRQRARRHCIPGIYGNPGNVESVRYRI